MSSAARAQSQFDAHWTQVADQYLSQRAIAAEKLKTRADAETRAREFKTFVQQALGGLPKVKTSLNAQFVGRLHEDGFDVERIVYDSAPGFHITANLYLPTSGHGPYPAVLETPGHYAAGKLEAWSFASNMARNGIAVLSYDPIGEGERLQYFDPSIGASRAERPTGEHTEASLQIALTDQHIARYFVWDAMRGVDYLVSRRDIDAQRIGAFGCSGGGTVTAYLAALDDRIKAVGTACYITGFHELLASIGPQEAEQTIPGFVSHGYDLADWIEAAAPRPYAVISTTEDMFPYEGARHAVEEARSVYGLYGASARVEWISGPGKHANLRPIYPQIIHFFLQRLAADDRTPQVVDSIPPPEHVLDCTSTGQVSTSLKGETLYSLNRVAAQKVIRAKPAIADEAALKRLQENLKKAVRDVNGLTLERRGGQLQGIVQDHVQRPGYTLEHLTFETGAGETFAAALAIPESGGRKPAVLLLDENASDESAREGGELDRFARSGNVVLAANLSPGAQDPQAKSTELFGPFYLSSLRVQLVGRTLVGVRTEETLRAIDWLASRSDVDPGQISAHATGAMGVVLLHAAALDARIRTIKLEHTLMSYRSALDAPLPRGLAQSEISGVLKAYDLDDLMIAMAPRKIELLEPVDGEGKIVPESNAREVLRNVFAADQKLGIADRVTFVDPSPQTQAPVKSSAHPDALN